MYPLNCGNMAQQRHIQGVANEISGLCHLRATPAAALPSSASADIERSENICYEKPQTFWFAAFFALADEQ